MIRIPRFSTTNWKSTLQPKQLRIPDWSHHLRRRGKETQQKSPIVGGHKLTNHLKGYVLNHTKKVTFSRKIAIVHTDCHQTCYRKYILIVIRDAKKKERRHSFLWFGCADNPFCNIPLEFILSQNMPLRIHPRNLANWYRKWPHFKSESPFPRPIILGIHVFFSRMYIYFNTWFFHSYLGWFPEKCTVSLLVRIPTPTQLNELANILLGRSPDWTKLRKV